MLFWHLGATLFLFRWIFRDPKVDLRFLLAGAVLPDLVDLPLGTLLLSGYSTGELWSHSLFVPAVYMTVVLVLTRRGRRRRAWMAVGVGWLFHLLLDAMWMDQQVFLWPFFGSELASGQTPYWPLAWERALSDPWRWLLELAGISYLTWLWAAHGLGDRERRRVLRDTGRLDEVEAHTG
ncbi:MAG: metal-dependent hydrolase [Actinobacteria bacterium]|nr:metal-dependent hydrolase [Actinomycetota bacterium]